jgi:hypothetical protein
MSDKKKAITISVKTKKIVKKLVKGTKQDPILLQTARRKKATKASYLKKRAEIMKNALAQLGILEHCVLLTENKVAMLTEYIESAPKSHTKRRKNK